MPSLHYLTDMDAILSLQSIYRGYITTTKGNDEYNDIDDDDHDDDDEDVDVAHFRTTHFYRHVIIVGYLRVAWYNANSFILPMLAEKILFYLWICKFTPPYPRSIFSVVNS